VHDCLLGRAAGCLTKGNHTGLDYLGPFNPQLKYTGADAFGLVLGHTNDTPPAIAQGN
jgi:hypothetical protein